MGLFGLSTKKEVEEKESRARAQGKRDGYNAGAQSVINSQRTSLGNLGKGSQVKFAVPYFDVFDPRFSDFGVPVAVHGMAIYAIDDVNKFNKVNKGESYSDAVFEQKLKGQLEKHIKSVVCNAPSEYNIQVLQLERKIIEISELIQNIVTPKIEKLFGINIRSIDVTSIMVDKTSRGYRELKSVTSDIEGDAIRMRSSLNLDAMKRQQEMTLGGQEEMQRMQLENQREIMRIQREEMQRGARLQTETNFLTAHQANLNAQVGIAQGNGGLFENRGGYQPQSNSLLSGSSQMTGNSLLSGSQQMPNMPQMPGMPPMPGAVPQVNYMVNVNNQPVGPCDWNKLLELKKQGQFTQQSYVWKEGMAQWRIAGQIQELTPIFQS